MKYNSEDYFTVRERRTHKKICDCGNLEDAKMVMSLDTPNREVVKNKSLMSPVIDIQVPKELPTTNVTVSNVKENGCTTRKNQLEDAEPLKLPEGQGEPVKV